MAEAALCDEMGPDLVLDRRPHTGFDAGVAGAGGGRAATAMAARRAVMWPAVPGTAAAGKERSLAGGRHGRRAPAMAGWLECSATERVGQGVATVARARRGTGDGKAGVWRHSRAESESSDYSCETTSGGAIGGERQAGPH